MASPSAEFAAKHERDEDACFSGEDSRKPNFKVPGLSMVGAPNYGGFKGQAGWGGANRLAEL